MRLMDAHNTVIHPVCFCPVIIPKCPLEKSCKLRQGFPDGVNLVMRNKQDIKVSSLRDLERGVDGRRRLRGASPAVNSVPSLRDLAGGGTEEALQGRYFINRGFQPADRDSAKEVLQGRHFYILFISHHLFSH
jgi:hypothetical protein